MISALLDCGQRIDSPKTEMLKGWDLPCDLQYDQFL